MIVAILGIILGLAIGFLTPVQIPIELARYSAIGILGIFDSMLGGLRADLQDKFRQSIFLTGLTYNMILAVAITYLGDKLSLDLYLAVIVVFTIRIFGNLGTIRYLLIEKYLGKKKVKEELEEKVL